MAFAARLRSNFTRTLNLRQAVRLVYNASPRLFFTGVALILVQSLMPIAMLYATKLMIDDITAQLMRDAADRDFSRVLLLIAIVGMITLLETVFTAIAGLVTEAQSGVVSDQIVSTIHDKSTEVDLEYYENAQVYDALHRAQSDAPYRPPRIVASLLRVGQSTVSLLGMVALLATINLWIALIVFAAAVPRLFVRLWSSRVLLAWTKRRSATERLLGWFSLVLTYPLYAKENRLFGLGRLFAARSEATRAALRRERLGLSARRARFDVAAQSVAIVALFAAYALVANDALLGGITIGSLVISFQAFQRAQGYFGDILAQLAALYEDNLFLDNYYRFMALESKVSAPAQPLPVPLPLREGIRFENVSFRYAPNAQDVLRDVTMHIAPGETIALVGENGAGKSTLVKLLCRLYDPTSGRITWDGIDIRQFDPAALRAAISAIFQDFVQYNMTAGENIWMGDISTPPDPARIEAAARKSEAHAVVESLPRGYDTLLGEYFDESRQISIGQWQKIALARAFYRDGQIIILDEPSAALDVTTEAAVFDHFRQIAQGKTALLISHRLSTVRMADRICVLDEGRIVEEGAHDALMAQDGIYAALFRTQAQNYRMDDPA